MGRPKFYNMDVTGQVAVFDNNARGKSVMIIANLKNAASIFIGDVDSQEVELEAGDSTPFIEIEKLNEILVYGTDGDRAQAILIMGK